MICFALLKLGSVLPVFNVLQNENVPPKLVREIMAIVGCTMVAIVEVEEEEYSSDDGDSISLMG
jgi:hypothetical protein